MNIYNDMKELYPICRSLTGSGTEYTLEYIKKNIPINIHKIKSGTDVFDWKIPKEWNIKNAYIKNSKGKKIVDFKKNNLHLMSYSEPVSKFINLKDLKKKLFSNKDFYLKVYKTL